MNKMLSLAVSIVLAVGLMPPLAWAVADDAYAEPSAPIQHTDEEIASTDEAMLASADYVEGEAVVCFLDSPLSDGDELSAQSESLADSLLLGAETLSTVTARQYAEATGEIVPASSDQDSMSAQTEQAPVRITLVHRDDMTTEQLLSQLLHDPRVLSAEPNYLMSFDATDQDGTSDAPDRVQASSEPDDLSAAAGAPDDDLTAAADAISDDLTAYQWSSSGVASTIPQYADATNPGVHSPNWNNPGETNADGVVVILDSGIDYTHPDLVNALYHFSPTLQEQLGCGEFGYAPARIDQTDPMDTYGHGTHCAGVVAADWNDFGVSGIANGVKVFSVCVAQSMTDNNFSYSTIIEGYDFIIRAARAGVDIRAINRSIEKTPTNNANQAMMQAAGELGIVTVVASGNKNTDIDAVYSDVAMYQANPYVLRVDASTLQDDRAWFSNFGKLTTDVFAPGVAILSTIPSNSESRHNYFAQADADPLYLESSFNGALPDVTGDDMYRSDVYSVAQGELGVDGDGRSLAVNVSVSLDRGSIFYIDVPVDNLSKDDLQDISLALYAPDVAIEGIEVGIMLEDGEYTPAGRDVNTSMSAPRGWCYAALHVSYKDLFYNGKDISHRIDSQGRVCIRLRIYGTFSKLGSTFGEMHDTTMYVDQIAIGGNDNAGYLPYQYMNGTSMAAPCVTGCAAIVSSRIDAASPAERAAQTVRALKGAVRQAKGYNGFCQQNGQIDLSLLDVASESVPVLESASISGDALVLKGANFGASKGTLLVGGKEAQVASWSNDTVKAKWPSGVASGLIPLTVKTSKGAEACRAFILEAPATAAKSTQLYERDLPPFSLNDTPSSIMDSPLSMAATDDGTLFAAVPDAEASTYTAVRYLMRSDDQGNSWRAIELPQELGNVSIAADDSKVYVYGSLPANDSSWIDSWILYCFDTAKGTFSFLDVYENDGDEVSETGVIASVGGKLYMIDCYADPDDYDAPKHMRIRRFADDYSLCDQQLLKHDYSRDDFYARPKVSTSDTSIYVLGFDDIGNYSTQEMTHGLERLDLIANGTFTCTDLSKAISSLECDATDVSIAACELGVFLIGNGLDSLLPSGAPYTDTFLLKTGASSFEPYARTLSFAPVHTPASMVADGWLYAYGVSRYEQYAQFGRATKAIPDKYEITFVLNGGTLNGKTGEVKATYEDGTVITLPAPTREGYTFSYWDGSHYAAGDSYTVKGDHTFTAVWEMADQKWTRLYGDNAFKTMDKIITAGAFAKGGTVVLASLEGYWDALTAAGVAGLEKAPVIMTLPTGLSPEATAQLKALAPTKIVVCGGSYWIPNTVLAEAVVAAGTTPKTVRLAGDVAVNTAEEIAAYGKGRWSDTAIIATVGTFQDALTAAPVSYAKAMPIYLAQFDFATETGSLADSTIKSMKANGITKVYIAGGTYWLPKGIVDQLDKAGIKVVKQLMGKTSVETSVAIANEAVSVLGMSANDCGLADARAHYDALASAPFSGKNGSVLLLVDPANTSSIDTFVKVNAKDISHGYIFGGENSVPADIKAAAEKAAK